MAAARRAALTCLSARFSFNDFPDFLLMVCRGDLSDIAGPFAMGPGSVPILATVPDGGDLRASLGPLRVYPQRSWKSRQSGLSQSYATDSTEQPLMPGTQVATFSWECLERLG